MRSLNKIVFINSAHIRYAEVAIDGNVHFTGTQGVGKTTLLRALLFFYNCRKDRLGIRTQGQQIFDNFYIPTPSSYIIYEVSRGDEEPPFSIILFRHHNRAAFRFVDAPYSKEWFVDSLGVVASDHITVRQRIQDLGIDLSSIIERYTQYLDILYGNRNASLTKDLLKYYLLKSQQYQNIPRIIQNVFLNERVDADFIKNIIISSITEEDEEIAVDLNFFRAKLAHFSDEIKDISLWTDANRHGIVETRRDADKIIQLSHNIKAAIHNLHEQCGMLNYAMNKEERDIPILKSKILKKEEIISQINNKIQDLTSKYNQECKKIEGQLAILTRDLKRASDLKKEYQRIGIDEMIARAENLCGLKLELQQKERQLAHLTSSHKSISDKYERLCERLNLDMEQYLFSLKERENTASSALTARERDRLKRKEKLESDIRNKFDTRLTDIEENLISYRNLLIEQKEQRAKAAVTSPMKHELTICEQSIAEAEKKIHQLRVKRLEEDKHLETLRNKLDLNCQQIEADTAMQIKVIEMRMNRLLDLRKEEQRILERANGSLCEWLDNNVECWEKNIGKIVDEENVLYSQNLNPRLTNDSSDTVFGITLDLSSIEKEVRTPSIIKEHIYNLDKEIQSFANSIIKIREEKDLRIAEVEKGIRSNLKAIQAEIDTVEQNIGIYNKQCKNELLRLDEIKEKENEYIREILAEFDAKIQELQVQIQDLSAERNEIKEKCNKELRQINKSISDEGKVDRIKHDEFLKSIDDDRTKYIAELNSRLKQLKEDEVAELSDSGADTRLLEYLKKNITVIQSSIDRIDKERETIAIYRNNCSTLLDHVEQMQIDRKKLEEDRYGLEQKYDSRRQNHADKKHEEEQQLNILRRCHDKTLESKQNAEEFVASNACPPEFKTASLIHTELGSTFIINAIKDLIGEIHRNSDDLKECTNEFRKRFSPNNTFKFPAIFDTIEDYHNYADSLEDFVSNDKIKDFQQLTSKLYRDILSRAASDFNILLGREYEIKKIIRDLNYDFENKTFAGVIRRIELRLDRSTMPIITQLQNITEFWNTNQYELGEINLFSTDGHSDINRESIKYLKSLSSALNNASDLKKLPLELTFALKFKISENDNTTDWVENIRAIGSEGTDILVKAIINILLISVFKKRSGQSDDFRLHCMMDEIGRLADENIQGILNFANQRGIFIVNSSPKAHRPLSYRRLYMLSKDNEANTIIQPILSKREAELR